ncbi:hypothetical protein [Sphaerotilus mobilis]|nr:hypothetical protein [Sphaerotilus mobilis]
MAACSGLGPADVSAPDVAGSAAAASAPVKVREPVSTPAAVASTAVPAVAVAPPPPPTWRALSTGPLETWTERRTPLYTYVLVGDIGSAAAGRGPRARAHQALVRLLSEVQAGDALDAELAAAHQFLVPAWPRTARQALPLGDAAAAPVALVPSDVDLIKSRAHLDLLRLVLARQPQMAQRLSGLGPFLVTTRQPLGELVQRSASGKVVVVDRSPVLLIDLGQRNESSLTAAVKALKVVARDAGGQTGAIGPMRARVLAKLRSAGVQPPHVAESPPVVVQRVK